jgi:SpoVK/Ycf46/Vps4 family AAA+-type ATPase
VFATNATIKVDEAIRRRITQIVEFKEPGPRTRRDIWRLHLPEGASAEGDLDLDALARRYELNGGLIKNAVRTALAASIAGDGSCPAGEPRLAMINLEEAAKEQLKNRLTMSGLHDSILPERGLESLVLRQDAAEAVREIADFGKALRVLDGDWGFGDTIGSRGGLAVLFHGPSGTGKTFAAEAIAFETGRSLRLVNYAKVMSMWVGETEKNLEKLFSEVAAEDAILLFDEADALFAPRSAVRSAQDRYLNLETDLLLGLVERYDVFSVLTTNSISNIDTAFLRRMRYVVEFELPDARLRLKLWRLLLPPRMPVAEDLDLPSLSEGYEFSGADIRDALVRAAASRALGDFGTSDRVTMADLRKACDSISRRHVKKDRAIGFARG